MSLLEQVKMPCNNEEKMGNDNFNNYLSKLQIFCNNGNNMSEDGHKPTYEAVKSELQDFAILSTPV